MLAGMHLKMKTRVFISLFICDRYLLAYFYIVLNFPAILSNIFSWISLWQLMSSQNYDCCFKLINFNLTAGETKESK